MNLQVWWINYVCEHWEPYEKEQPWYEDNAWVKASEAEAEIARLNTALDYIIDIVGTECKCYKEPEVNYVEECVYCVAKEALEGK